MVVSPDIAGSSPSISFDTAFSSGPSAVSSFTEFCPLAVKQILISSSLLTCVLPADVLSGSELLSGSKPLNQVKMNQTVWF